MSKGFKKIYLHESNYIIKIDEGIIALKIYEKKYTVNSSSTNCHKKLLYLILATNYINTHSWVADN